MSNLTAFLAQNALKPENEKVVVSKRFINPETKKPMEWEVAAITSEEDDLLRKDNTKRMPVPGKKGVMVPETNYTAYLADLAAKCTVFPNLHDVELQKSYGVMGAKELLKKMLLPGEYDEYLATVQKINGFDVGMGELVEEAKN
ncbi:phage tail assembly chaperone [Lysinibacillus xylanilyticus]|uniref:phage tail assembly chaperone n=1 Tax=Lysinibacillus xylanilyticus TaxID=582475 RepID=UPI00083C9E8D|nr:phage portal protein [Lysinibacillus xylanilyticus]